MLRPLRKTAHRFTHLAVAGVLVAAGVTAMANPASASGTVTLTTSTGSTTTGGSATATTTALLSYFHVIFPDTFTSTGTWPVSYGTCPAGVTFKIDTVAQTSPGQVKCQRWSGGGEIWWSVQITGGANFAAGKVLTLEWTSALLTTPATAGSYTVNVTDAGTSSLTLVPTVLTITAPASSGGSGSDPSPILQQYGLHENGTCGGTDVAHLNWAGVADGGWGRSWAAWANEGRGGAVCTRTLRYDSGLAHWTHD